MKQGPSYLPNQIQLGESVIAHASTSPGPPIVCLHGFGGSGLDFDVLATHLVQHQQIIGLNLPGHGGVEFTSKPRQSIVDSIHAVCTTPFVLMGYSMGGRIALELAQASTLPITKLILIGTTPGYRNDTERHERITFEAKVKARLTRDSVAGFESWWRTLPPIKTQSRMPEPFYEEMLNRRLRNHLGHLAESLCHFGTSQMSPMWSKLTQLNMPVLLLAGETDQKYRTLAHEMDSHLKHSRFVTITDAGHAPHLESPRATAAVIRQFLSQDGTE
ncbi:MAG: alpha/beta fold hydrolase [Bradymonadia bacterium]